MAHEMKINYGIIINNTQTITGVTTNSGLTGVSDYNLPTEKAVKLYVDNKVYQSNSGLSYTLSGLTDVAINSPQFRQSLVYDGSKWVNSGNTTDLSPYYTSAQTNANFLSANTSYYTQAQANANFLSANTNFSLYVTTGTTQTISGQKTFSGPVFMLNGLTVSGTTTFINTQNLNVSNNYITVNSGETGSGVTAGFAGLIVKRGVYADYYIDWSETQGNFRVGASGQTQAVATRQDTPTPFGIAYWNLGGPYRFDTSTAMVFNTGSSTLVMGAGAGISTPYLTASTYAFVNNLTVTNANITTLTASTIYISTISLPSLSTVGITGTSLYVSGPITSTGLISTTNNINSTGTIQGNIISGQTLQSVTINASGTITGNVISGQTIQSPYANHTTLTATTLYSTTANLTTVNSTTINATGTIQGNVISGQTVQAPLGVFQTLSGVTNIDGMMKKISNASVSSTGTIVDSFNNTIGKGVVYHYNVTNGTDSRTGTINAAYTTGTTVEYNDYSTVAIGTVTCEMLVENTGGNINFRPSSITGTWGIYVTRILIG